MSEDNPLNLYAPVPYALPPLYSSGEPPYLKTNVAVEFMREYMAEEDKRTGLQDLIKGEPPCPPPPPSNGFALGRGCPRGGSWGREAKPHTRLGGGVVF